MLKNQLHSNQAITDEASIPFKAVFIDYYSALCFFANKMVNDTAVAEDIVEDSFIKLWKKEPDFSKHRNIRAALYITVKNACLDFIKAKQRERRKRSEFSWSQQRMADFALNEMIRAEVLRKVYAALQQLPPERRRVMNLLFVEGWDSEKVAKHLDISIHTVKKHRLNGIRALQKKLGISPLFLFYLHHFIK